MKIKKERLREIRKKVEDQLSKVPQGQRIKLPKDQLETLIFDNYVSQMKYDTNCSFEVTRVPFKLIAWNMPFYDRLDLSEVSFDNVYWGDERIIHCSDEISPEIQDIEFVYRPIIDLSNTNAKIDFSKGIQVPKMDNKFTGNQLVHIIRKYDFSNTDLSNNKIGNNYIFIDTDLSNTNININFESNSLFEIYNCNLTNVDLSEHTLGIESFQVEDCNNHPFITACILKNTGLRINLPTYACIKTNSNLKEMIIRGYLKGCIINDRIIKTGSEDERKANKENLIMELEDYYNKFEESISESIKKQIIKK